MHGASALIWLPTLRFSTLPIISIIITKDPDALRGTGSIEEGEGITPCILISLLLSCLISKKIILVVVEWVVVVHVSMSNFINMSFN